MDRFPHIFRLLGAALFLIGVCAGVWHYFASDREPVSSASQSSVRSNPSAQSGQPTPFPHQVVHRVPLKQLDLWKDHLSHLDPDSEGFWDEAFQTLYTSDLDEREIVSAMVQLIAIAPPDAQSDLAPHVATLIDDRDYDSLRPLLVEGNLTLEALDFMMGDLHSRPDAIKDPVFREIAQMESHPMREEALHMQELLEK